MWEEDLPLFMPEKSVKRRIECHAIISIACEEDGIAFLPTTDVEKFERLVGRQQLKDPETYQRGSLSPIISALFISLIELIFHFLLQANGLEISRLAAKLLST